jgi:Na+/phosphate symporter
MSLQTLMQKRRDLNNDILNSLQQEVLEIKESAENMIECATNITGQGYPTFISARKDFLKKLDKFSQQLADY